MKFSGLNIKFRMKVFLFLFLFFSIALQASEAERLNAAKLIQQEISELSFKKEYNIFLKYEREISALDHHEANAYSKNSTRFKILDELLKIQQKSKSLIIAQYQVNQTLKYVNIKDSAKFMKYAKSSIDLLYENRLCDGFLLMGDYKEKISGNKIEALKVYEQGFKVCKVKWKQFELRARVGQAKYRLGKTKGL